ncbi:hypothetical protein NQ317_005219 [Molorchus minor]|uniref:Kinesin-like protein n=1 Tax=Molorchus minor TaxID=1323400 RepID=A0ABQ9JPU6_9CUCU|nr:hypothetical protein NQ317_005219 [Molorchus minor]
MYTSSKCTPTPRKLRREKTTLSTNSDCEREPVHVYCRLRPLTENLEASCVKLLSSQELALVCETKGVRKEIRYKFKHIFTAYSTQKEVFDHVAYPLLEDLLKGKNGLLFTYGVTGSGKTYTLSGEQNNPGVMPRCIDTIFNSIRDFQAPKFVIKSDKMNGFEVQTEEDAMQDRLKDVRNKSCNTRCKTPRKVNGEKVSYANDGTRIPLLHDNSLYSVFVSYIEIYNNSVFDLLDEQCSGRSLQNKILREDSQKNMYVNGAVEVEVKSAEEAYEAFNSGQKRKRMGYTVLNAESSRSHSVFNIRVVQLEQVAWVDGKPTIPDRNLITIGQLSLVDLAGSERTNRTQNTGARLKEASSINNSLMTLRTCLEILRENQYTKTNKMVPYRDSRLTYLFKHYFEGEGSVQMIVCVNPSADDFEENLHVMKFAEMTQDVKITKTELKTPKTVIKKAADRIQTPMKIKSGGFTLLPDIPVGQFDIENAEEVEPYIDKIIRALKHRKNKAKTVDREIKESTEEFRKRLVDLNQEHTLNKTEVASLKQMIRRQKQKTHNLEVKIKDLENVNMDVSSKNDELQERKKKPNKKSPWSAKKMGQELDAKLRKQREHLNAAIKTKEFQLQKVRDILNNETIVDPLDLETLTDKENALTQTPKSTVDHQSRRNVISSTPRHRRSRSVGEVWLEHNAVKPVPLGTVLQPSMKKRKSVSKLTKAGDVTNPKQSKYCLVTQDQDTDGEVETKLYKGDIVPTCGGGAQVIFNDVERLTQESPTS